MTILANEKQREALASRKAAEAELDKLMKAESARLRRAHASKGPHNPTTRTKTASAPKGWNYRKIDDSTVSKANLDDDEQKDQLSNVTEGAFDQLSRVLEGRRRIAELQTEEKARMQAVMDAKAKRSRAAVTVSETQGRRVTVRKFQTRSERLLSSGIMPRHLKAALDDFSVLCADALGVATADNHNSTSRTTGQYEGSTASAPFGSRSPSDREIIGARALRLMSGRIPAELRDAFVELVGEEVGYRSPMKRTLAELGAAMFGYKSDRQASAAGAATICNLAALIRHFLQSPDLKYCEKLSTDLIGKEKMLQAA